MRLLIVWIKNYSDGLASILSKIQWLEIIKKTVGPGMKSFLGQNCLQIQCRASFNVAEDGLFIVKPKSGGHQERRTPS